MPYSKLLILAAFAASTIYIHFRGRVRLGFWRQLSDHSTLMAPINCVMYLFSRVPAKPYLSEAQFPELKTLTANWERIREEALRLYGAGDIKASSRYDDLGFNSFFKTGWKRFYLKWYGADHPSARERCPYTTALLAQYPQIKAAMFTALPPGGRLVQHRDPYAGSVRYHLGLITPNDDHCYIAVDGQRYSWRDGQAVLFDETYLHYAENASGQNRIILFCDVERPMWFPPAAWLNRLLGRILLAAARSPNQEGDHTGGLNRAFHYVQQLRLFGKRIKARNRFAYYCLKWLLLAGPIVLWLCWDAL
ncbi:MAG: aspartyl/asparaginyl beta-hydroxylase domain-containing protein [Paludibacterium sp.]|uniref:aspartyl/asparaginyl beta-hydroxylase domain-containing protein n=1 Tax=Paludibacterium sp. TaxID=1917523 RepID=UPI0025D63EB4|nr:aspartyl/asparaginyl beta-hydroxylase domain-containing protein [Paludibacterium sp.]MBV8045895.1 aspartyl/asparaginyl beta-hydroxylase domain-containing protein [Paludibacterium sp.]MBV8646444.1 aspartyl/asparaginyl beta-hydroxylase domain-containing protein [Paludibacterium sp.]